MLNTTRASSRTPLKSFASLTLAASCLLGAPATAQDYPNKPIRYIVPNTPGVIVDIVARVMAAKMRQTLGQPADHRKGARR